MHFSSFHWGIGIMGACYVLSTMHHARLWQPKEEKAGVLSLLQELLRYGL